MFKKLSKRSPETGAEMYNSDKGWIEKIVLVVLFIVALLSLILGTHSVYTDTLTTDTGTVNPENFYFAQVGGSEADFNFSIAPGQSHSVSVTVYNYNSEDNTDVCGVDLDVAFVCNTSGALVEYLSWDFDYESCTLAAKTPESFTTTLTVSMARNVSWLSIRGKSADFSIAATATQHFDD